MGVTAPADVRATWHINVDCCRPKAAIKSYYKVLVLTQIATLDNHMKSYVLLLSITACAQFTSTAVAGALRLAISVSRRRLCLRAWRSP
jgi:hypothetical protein